MRWHALEPDAVLDALAVTASGLTTEAAAVRRARVGPNAQPEPRRPSRWARAGAQLANPLNYLLERAVVEQPGIGDDRVAGGQRDHVAGDEVARVDRLLLAVADHPRVLRGEPAERLQRVLGAALLQGADGRVERHHDRDHDRVAVLPEDDRDRRGTQQVVGMIPEGLPIAMTIGLAVGVQRMARRGAIVRRLGAVETLGSTTMICSDKTGTLTRNEMTVVELFLPGRGSIAVTGTGYQPTGGFEEGGRTVDAGADVALRRLLEACALCNDASVIAPEDEDGRWRALGDPTEAALVTAAIKGGVIPDAVRAHTPREAELPFDAATRMMATQHTGRIVFIKGAPEVVLELCASADDRTAALAAADRMAAGALRVLAVAIVENAALDGGVAALRGRAMLLGLVGQLDPPRDEVVASIARCRAAGTPHRSSSRPCWPSAPPAASCCGPRSSGSGWNAGCAITRRRGAWPIPHELRPGDDGSPPAVVLALHSWCPCRTVAECVHTTTSTIPTRPCATRSSRARWQSFAEPRNRRRVTSRA